MNDKINKYLDKEKPSFVDEYLRFPLYLLSHPLKGFEIFKREKRGKVSVAVVFIIVLVLLNILSFQFSGFEVNDNDLRDLNSIAEVSYIVGIVALLTVANWSVTTLFDGKGKMKDIFLMIGYSLFPLIWSTAAGIILSNILTGDELGIYYVVTSLGLVLTCYMIFMGMIAIHEYGLGKCVLTILFTIIAAAVILFVLLLAFNLFQTMYGFLYTIYQEITLRNLI